LEDQTHDQSNGKSHFDNPLQLFDGMRKRERAMFKQNRSLQWFAFVAFYSQGTSLPSSIPLSLINQDGHVELKKKKKKKHITKKKNKKFYLFEMLKSISVLRRSSEPFQLTDFFFFFFSC